MQRRHSLLSSCCRRGDQLVHGGRERSAHCTAFGGAPKAAALGRSARPHNRRPRPTEQRHAHGHGHWHRLCGVGPPGVRRKRPFESRIRKRRVWGHRRASRGRIAAGGGLRATGSCLSAVASQPHPHHGQCTACGRGDRSAAADFASHRHRHQRCLCQSRPRACAERVSGRMHSPVASLARPRT